MTAPMSLIVDCGGHSIKAGISSDTHPLIIPNCISRTKLDRHKSYVGSELFSLTDTSGLMMVLAFQKGYLLNWGVERQLFDHIFGPTHLNISPQDTDLIFTEPPFNFASIRDTLDEILFEEYGFKSVTRSTSANLSAYHYKTDNPSSPASMVLDSGFSFTHVMPFCEMIPVTSSFLRVDVGGKFLTNRLKDLISYRQLNVAEETYVINQVKEDTCYISRDIYSDMSKCKKETVKFRESNKLSDSGTLIHYILPDFSLSNRGFIHDPSSNEPCPPDRTLALGNERFSVPELIFHPSDIGLDQMGLPEAVRHSLTITPPPMCESLTRNILVTGGNSLFPGFKHRLYSDLRASLPAAHFLNIFLPPDPIAYAWEGGKRLATTELSARPPHLTPISFEEYMEQGHSAWKLKMQFSFTD